MTVETEGNDEGLALDTTENQQGNQETATTDQDIDNDPMLAGLKEAEVDEAANGGAEGAENQETAAATSAQTKDEGDKATIMVPKARLDEVISQRKLLEDQVNFLKGVSTTQQEMLKSQPGTTGNGEESGKQTSEQNPDHNSLIEKAENEKLELARKYEDGEISLVEFKKGEIDLDRSIRGFNEQRTIELVKASENKATEIVNANNRQMSIEDAALDIQAKHPYVAEMENLPKPIYDGVWEQITTEAKTNLAAKGINADDGTIGSHVALMQEKARLTDTYGPRYTGKTLEVQNNGQGKEISETARNRARKIDISNQQPPETSSAAVGSNARTELTEKDIENMSQDQLADHIAQNPREVQKAAGFRNL